MNKTLALQIFEKSKKLFFASEAEALSDLNKKETTEGATSEKKEKKEIPLFYTDPIFKPKKHYFPA